MSKGIAAVIVAISLHLMSGIMVFSQPETGQSMRFMFYNVENLFDIYDDPAVDDDEFLPDAERRWSVWRYRTKINSLFKTISAAGEWSPPAIVGLCEVENRKVMEDLIYTTNLSKFNYGIIHEDSHDPRGIDVCLIYRKEIVNVLSWCYFRPVNSEGIPAATRSVLYSKVIAGEDTIHIFVNHWPSRRGGVLAGESTREDLALMLRSKADSLAGIYDCRINIIIMGDFNATPDDNVIRMISEPFGSGLSLVNLSETLGKSKGTYRYRGTWEIIDQIIISGYLPDHGEGESGLRAVIKIFDPDFLLKKDPVYPGLSPFSTWSGYRYQGGFSDHLPVLLDLILR